MKEIANTHHVSAEAEEKSYDKELSTKECENHSHEDTTEDNSNSFVDINIDVHNPENISAYADEELIACEDVDNCSYASNNDETVEVHCYPNIHVDIPGQDDVENDGHSVNPCDCDRWNVEDNFISDFVSSFLDEDDRDSIMDDVCSR